MEWLGEISQGFLSSSYIQDWEMKMQATWKHQKEHNKKQTNTLPIRSNNPPKQLYNRYYLALAKGLEKGQTSKTENF